MSARQLPPHLEQKVDTLKQSLETPLAATWTYKAPTGFDDALEESCREGARNVWLNAGFQAWYAWFKVGRTAQEALKELPEPDIWEIARSVCSIQPDDTVQTLFQHIFHGSNRSSKRRRLLQSKSYSYPNKRIPAPSTSSIHRQTSSISSNNENDESRADSLGQPDNQHNDFGQQLPVDTNEQQPSSSRQPLEVINIERSFPEPKYLPNVFPYQTCVSIVKTSRQAAVYTDSADLKLDIKSASIPHIARELFGAIIQVEHGRLYMTLDSGSSVTFNEITLSGANHMAAKKIFGEAYTAVSGGAHFKHELERGELLTRFIRLELQGDANKSSRLCIQGDAASIASVARATMSFKRTARWISGDGQKIYWNNSFIWVCKAGDNIAFKLIELCNGQATVSKGLIPSPGADQNSRPWCRSVEDFRHQNNLQGRSSGALPTFEQQSGIAGT
ncbi:hypothetical protein VM1G_11441 [Cytospora mali]|uniref:Uncharacterized protein n=1 Tax=Cytospora mali TaxID=578113 RepID=A0A194VQT9_CYTMA|nr:hypothetical protein VM1G_11441 [Valsa mali]